MYIQLRDRTYGQRQLRIGMPERERANAQDIYAITLMNDDAMRHLARKISRLFAVLKKRWKGVLADSSTLADADRRTYR